MWYEYKKLNTLEKLEKFGKNIALVCICRTFEFWSSEPINAFSFFPLSLFGLSWWGGVGSNTILFTVEPLSIVLSSVRPTSWLGIKKLRILTNGMCPCPLFYRRRTLLGTFCHQATQTSRVLPSCYFSTHLCTDGRQTSCRRLKDFVEHYLFSYLDLRYCSRQNYRYKCSCLPM